MPNYLDFSKQAQQGGKQLAPNTGVANTTATSTGPGTSPNDLMNQFGDLAKTGAVDFTKGIFGDNKGYADTVSKWGDLAKSGMSFCGL